MKRSPSIRVRTRWPLGGSRAAPALLAVLAALAAPAAAEIIDLSWNAQGRFERSVTVLPGKFSEVCGPLRAGDTVTWRFEAAQPLNFNIHYHEGKDIRYPERRDGLAQGEGELRVQLRQDYCWMWTNKSAQPVPLQMRLTRGGG